MKKVIITMTMLLALGMGVQAASQKHRHTPQAPTELVDSANKDAVEVYSDTTGTDTAVTHTRSHKEPLPSTRPGTRIPMMWMTMISVAGSTR